MRPFWTLVARDLKLAKREGAALGTALGFYLVVVTLTPLGLGPDPDLLSRVAPGILWIALLLSALLSLGRIFEADDEDGSLEVMALGELPLELIAAAKALAHWLSTGIPLTLMAPILAIMLNLESGAYGILVLTLLLGTPAISFLGLIGAALTLRAKKGGLLLALIVLPLYVPTLIFGILSISAALTGMGGLQSTLLILAAISLGSLVMGPIASAAALRIQLQ